MSILSRIQSAQALCIDAALCASMNLIQSRNRLRPGSLAALKNYLDHCKNLDPAEYYGIPSGDIQIRELRSNPNEPWSIHQLDWKSPLPTSHQSNNNVRAWHHRLAPDRPTVLLLHALMSTSDSGYKRIAADFNRLGWNAVFIHLPWHYSRVPKGFANGELAVTSDLVQTAESLRQAVVELRQLMAWLRARGCPAFGLWGTSWGGWIASLLSSLEDHLHFMVLMVPVLDVEHIIWRSPISVAIRQQLRKADIAPTHTNRHAHLTSPLHTTPRCEPSRILLLAGKQDRIVPPSILHNAAAAWNGACLTEVNQGHFGYKMKECALAWTRNHLQ